MRRIDAATVAGYYGSDSAGTYATAKGVMNSLAATGAAGAAAYQFKAYMPVMLAVHGGSRLFGRSFFGGPPPRRGDGRSRSFARRNRVRPQRHADAGDGGRRRRAWRQSPNLARTQVGELGHPAAGLHPTGSLINGKLLHEVFLNPGLYLLFGGIVIGLLSGLQNQGPEPQNKTITGADDKLFLDLFQGALCLFLLEMGMTASRKLRDLKQAGWPFVLLGLGMPPVFATFGLVVAHLFNTATHADLTLGTYVMFAILCASSSYIAVPAVQRLAIPEASPTLPLAASLGLTFTFNVTVASRSTFRSQKRSWGLPLAGSCAII